MVIGEQFVWSHLGKTGGDSVARMFEIVGGPYLHADAIDTPLKHDTFAGRTKRMDQGEMEFIDLSGKKRILNIRRLPYWLLSHGLHKRDVDDMGFDLNELAAGKVRYKTHPGNPRTADTMLSRYSDDGEVDFWIRTEHMADDFISIIGQFVPISADQEQQLRATRENVNSSYDRDITRWFSKSDLEKMYDLNPFWASIERRLYGNTVADDI